MTTRILPKSEYDRLKGTELGILIETKTMPEQTEVVVVEDGDTIIGCWSLMMFYHCEGVWIHPSYRMKSSVARRLWVAMQSLASKHGIRRMLTGCLDRGIQEVLEKHGAVQIPGLTYAIPVGEARWPQPFQHSSVA